MKGRGKSHLALSALPPGCGKLASLPLTAGFPSQPPVPCTLYNNALHQLPEPGTW